MNKSYKYQTIKEAVVSEMSESFVREVKRMDTKVVARRLLALYNSRLTDDSFFNIIGQFNSIVNCETSADE